MDGPINFIQANLMVSPKAHYTLEAFIPICKPDVCLISEPNFRIANEKNLIMDRNGDAAIWIVNTDMRVNKLIKGRGYVGATLNNILIVSVYISPNITHREAEKILEDLGLELNTWKGHLLIGGDFNAKSKDWGSAINNKRGYLMKEWMAEHNLYLLNDGSTPTFLRGIQESFIDLTMCSEQIVEHVVSWKVREDQESNSDHRFITFQYANERGEDSRPTNYQKRGWKLDETMIPALQRAILEGNSNHEEPSASNLVKIITSACDKVLPRKNIGRHKWKPVPWWTDNINTLRKDCIRKRRSLTRAKKRVLNQPDTLEILLKDYKNAKITMNNEIKKSREAEWKKVCDEVEKDIWGRGYKIVTNKYKKKTYSLAPEKQKEILETLFPKHARTTWTSEIETENIEEFTMDELISVLIRTKKKKAPGPDGITPEILKIAIEAMPQYVLDAFNKILKAGIFPDEWKVAKVVLLLKPGKSTLEPSSYRPLCLLDTYGKFLESMIVNRLNKELGVDGLSANQFGFRRGRSTIDAIHRIYDIADRERRKKPKERRLCLLLAFDVRNAFNSASWERIIAELERKSIPSYLVRIVKSYLNSRKIVMDDIHMDMTAGVPQGSVAAAILWNILYDGVLRLDMPEGVYLTAYADDLAMVVTAKDEERLERIAEISISRVLEWMNQMDLQLAPEKTEATLLIGRKQCKPIQVRLMGENVQVKDSIKYLGVMLDKRLNFRPHIEYIAEKASRMSNSLIRIMPRQGGATVLKRKLLNNVAESTILYAAPVWKTAVRVQRNRAKLESAQRIMLLRICRTYRTVSTEALQVIAGIPPIDLLVEERASCYGRNDEEKATAKDITKDKWQERWTIATNGSWTRRLIPYILPWQERQHGEVSFHMAQILSGHGCFQGYLKRFGKINSDICMFCSEVDNAEHTLFLCSRWGTQRAEMEAQIGADLNVDNLVYHMLRSKGSWDIIARCMNTVMKAKEDEERRRKSSIAQSGQSTQSRMSSQQ